jgi:hypothetical protein
MNKYRATAYTHGIPKDAGRPIKVIEFEAANHAAAVKTAHSRMSGQSVVGVKVL